MKYLLQVLILTAQCTNKLVCVPGNWNEKETRGEIKGNEWRGNEGKVDEMKVRYSECGRGSLEWASRMSAPPFPIPAIAPAHPYAFI